MTSCQRIGMVRREKLILNARQWHQGRMESQLCPPETRGKHSTDTNLEFLWPLSNLSRTAPTVLISKEEAISRHP